MKACIRTRKGKWLMIYKTLEVHTLSLMDLASFIRYIL